MFNKKNLFYRILSLISIFCIICSLSFSVFAASSTSIFNPLDYGIIDFWTDNAGVTYDVKTPSDWAYSILCRSRDLYILGGYSGQVVQYDSWSYDRDKVDLFAHPFGTNSSYWSAIGEVVKQGHLCDIRSIPRNSFFQSSFVMDFTNRNIDYSSIVASYKLFFVNEDNQIVYSVGGRFNSPIADFSDSDFVRLICQYSFNLKDFDIPGNAVAMYPVYYIEDIDFSTDTYLTIRYQELRMGFSMSSLEFESQQNNKLNNTIDKIESQLGDVINGTPQQNQQVQDAVGDLNNSSDELGSLGDQMASVDKPTINSNQISADSLVPQTALVAFSMPFQSLWENNQLLAMLTIVVTLVLVSWVFFGKKG